MTNQEAQTELAFGYAAGQPTPVFAPWEQRPQALWSLLDMLIFSASSFFWCGRALRTISGDAVVGSVSIHGDQPVFHTAMDIDPQALEKALRLLPDVEKTFREIGLHITAETVRDVIDELKAGQRYSFDWLANQCKNLERLAEKEMKNKLFLYVPPERAKYWPKVVDPHPFGESVASAFASTTFDAMHASTCLAMMESTASVFHCMRILEVGLAAMGAEFGVSLANTNWAPALSEIERRVRAMNQDAEWRTRPDCKEMQEFYSQAASHFGILKDAWRNHVMHTRGKYTEDEAERVYESVKAFMQKLSARLSEPVD